MPEPLRSWHGFRDWVDFTRATLSLGAVISALLWGVLTYALDGRYAPATINNAVNQNHQVATAVAVQVEHLQKNVTEVQATILKNAIFDFRVKSCHAANAESRLFFARRLQELQDQYNALGVGPTQTPTCGDIQ